MNARRLSLIYLICLACCIAGTSAFARESGSSQDREVAPRPAAVAPQRPAPRAPARLQSPVPVDSVAEDLQKIVVLCATEPTSEAFKTEWAKYIEMHPVAAEDLDALIDDVLERADAYRAQRSLNSRTNRTATIPTTRTMMHDTAMAVIRKIG
jgi:hypothetical protein